MRAHRVRVGVMMQAGLFYAIAKVDDEETRKVGGPFLTEDQAEEVAAATSRMLRAEFDAEDYDGPDPANRDWHPMGQS